MTQAPTRRSSGSVPHVDHQGEIRADAALAGSSSGRANALSPTTTCPGDVPPPRQRRRGRRGTDFATTDELVLLPPPRSGMHSDTVPSADFRLLLAAAVAGVSPPRLRLPVIVAARYGFCCSLLCARSSWRRATDDDDDPAKTTRWWCELPQHFCSGNLSQPGEAISAASRTPSTNFKYSSSMPGTLSGSSATPRRRGAPRNLGREGTHHGPAPAMLRKEGRPAPPLSSRQVGPSPSSP